MKVKILSILSVVMLLSGCVTLDKVRDLRYMLQGKPTSEQVAKMELGTLSALYKEYRENPLAADKKYDGKWLKFAGTLKNIQGQKNKDIGSISAYNPKGNETVRYSFSVTEKSGEVASCTLGDEFGEKDLIDLKNGQQVTVLGKITRYTQFGNGIDPTPLFTECEIVKK